MTNAIKEPVEAKSASKTASSVRPVTGKAVVRVRGKIQSKTTDVRKALASIKRLSNAAPGVRPVTGKAIARLRGKFGMSQKEFARLLGVSTLTIGKWEKRPGKLHLQTRMFDSWEAAERLTKRQAGGNWTVPDRRTMSERVVAYVWSCIFRVPNQGLSAPWHKFGVAFSQG